MMEKLMRARIEFVIFEETHVIRLYEQHQLQQELVDFRSYAGVVCQLQVLQAFIFISFELGKEVLLNKLLNPSELIIGEGITEYECKGVYNQCLQ